MLRVCPTPVRWSSWERECTHLSSPTANRSILISRAGMLQHTHTHLNIRGDRCSSQTRHLPERVLLSHEFAFGNPYLLPQGVFSQFWSSLFYTDATALIMLVFSCSSTRLAEEVTLTDSNTVTFWWGLPNRFKVVRFSLTLYILKLDLNAFCQ